MIVSVKFIGDINVLGTTIGAWMCNFAPLYRFKKERHGAMNQPTDHQTDRMGHREVTLQTTLYGKESVAVNSLSEE